MAYRESLDAANARIEALEHQVIVLQAAVAPVAEIPDTTRLTTPRERELTRALAEARHEIDEMRHDEALSVRPSRIGRAVPAPTPKLFAVAAIGAAVIVFVFSLLER